MITIFETIYANKYIIKISVNNTHIKFKIETCITITGIIIIRINNK
jgi:hypothetical protein